MKTSIISDTHRRHEELNPKLERSDLFIHCGDFSGGTEKCTRAFLDWFSGTPAPIKILVCGNHDGYAQEIGKEAFKDLCFDFGILYLEDESIEIEGIKFYGTPWTPEFKDWHFMGEDEDLKKYWDLIDDDTQVLITHGPQHGTLDRLMEGGIPSYLGSRTLASRIRDLKSLKYHFCGHIHGQTGFKDKDEFTNYESINAAALWEFNQDRDTLKGPLVTTIIIED